MSKLDDVLERTTLKTWELDGDVESIKNNIKQLLADLIDETFEKNDDNAYRLWQKIQSL